MKKHIALIGVEQNKKQIAKKLADTLGMMLFDCHDYICFNNNMSVEQLIKKSNVTYFKKQVSKAICELDDLENMVFCSYDHKLLSVDDLQTLSTYAYVIYLFDKNSLQNDGENCVLQDEKFLQLCVRVDKRYGNRCDFALDIANKSDDDVVEQICEYLKTLF